MAHIELENELPGIRGPLAYSPTTAKPLGELVEVLLRGPSTLTKAERELIATHVSFRNGCHFCHNSHGAIAAEHLGGSASDYALVEEVRRHAQAAPVSEKMRALLTIAGLVQQDGKLVAPGDITRAREHGATDREIHDVVLIAAAFSMYNRYVDGLATWQPQDSESYRQAGKLIAQRGYLYRDVPSQA